MVREHGFSYNCKVIPPSNEHVFVVRDHFFYFGIITYFRRAPRGCGGRVVTGA